MADGLALDVRGHLLVEDDQPPLDLDLPLQENNDLLPLLALLQCTAHLDNQGLNWFEVYSNLRPHVRDHSHISIENKHSRTT